MFFFIAKDKIEREGREGKKELKKKKLKYA
jgi:hypothetical protein